MKNTIFKLSATLLSALMFTACSKKSEPVPPEVETAPEQPFIELAESDFKEINVTVTHSDDPLPSNVELFDTAGFDFGEKLPPCKTEELKDELKPYYIDDYYEPVMLEEYEKTFTTPAKGEIRNGIADRENLYFFVDYDIHCSGSHETAIWGYNTVTEELEELCSLSDAESGYFCNGMAVAEGTLYVNFDKSIYAVDREAHELKEIYNVEEMGGVFIYSNSADRLIITKKTPINPDGDDYENYEGNYVCFLEYVPESDEWNEIYSFETEGYYWGMGDQDFVYSEIIAYKEKPEGSRKYDVVTDYYRISTGLTNIDIIYASTDKVIVSAGDALTFAGSTMLHCYDIAKKEHYVLDTNKYGDRFYACGGNVIISKSHLGGMTDKDSYTVSYLIPEIGMVFDIVDSNELVFPMYSDGTAGFFARINSSIKIPSIEDQNMWTNYYYTDKETFCRITK